LTKWLYILSTKVMMNELSRIIKPFVHNFRSKSCVSMKKILLNLFLDGSLNRISPSICTSFSKHYLAINVDTCRWIWWGTAVFNRKTSNRYCPWSKYRVQNIPTNYLSEHWLILERFLWIRLDPQNILCRIKWEQCLRVNKHCIRKTNDSNTKKKNSYFSNYS